MVTLEEVLGIVEALIDDRCQLILPWHHLELVKKLKPLQVLRRLIPLGAFLHTFEWIDILVYPLLILLKVAYLSQGLLSVLLPEPPEHLISDPGLPLRKLNDLFRESEYRVVRFQDLKHVSDVLTLKDLVLQDLNQSETNLEKGLASLKKEEVQDLERGLLWHIIGENAHEPLEG